ncbi:glutamine synthetase [Xylaria arbuscula]|nr:glutamine synthetase [Xylaria arbuscula]
MRSDKEKLEKFLDKNKSIKYIRLQWVDYSGILRARFVPIARCLGTSSGREATYLTQSSLLLPISTLLLEPDWSSIRRCGFKSDHAAVMCYVDQNDDIDTSFEIEFVLLDPLNNVIEPLDSLNGYSRTAGLRAGTLDLVEEIMKALEQSSIHVLYYHAEVKDQLKIALVPQLALKAVDSLVLAQETIRTICVRRNLKATMTPKPTLTGPSSGLYLHFVFYSSRPAFEATFIAGILDHMSSLCAFGMANYDSYVRSVSDAAGAWIGFGTNNRDLPVRKIKDRHWEFRMMDGTANPYLFVAAVNTELIWKDCRLFPDSMDETRRAGYGLHKRMPVTVKEALDCLKDTALKKRIGEDLLEWFISVEDREVDEFAKMTDEQRRLRFLEYF